MNKMSRRLWGQRVLAIGGQLGLASVAMPARVLSMAAPTAAALAGLMTDEAYAAQGDEHVANLVVGSGYGGAVTALRLAQAGQPVTMLEMGRLWNTPGKDGKVFCKPFSPDDRAMWFKDRITAVFSTIGTIIPVSSLLKVPVAAGILDVVSSPNMDVYLGRGVGGGSLVNLAMLITPYRETLQRILPSSISIDELYSTYYPRARAGLGGNMIRPAYYQASAYHKYARVACAQAAKAGFQWRTLDSGYDMAYMEQEEAGLVPKSALGSEGGFGNNYGKKSLDKTYLAEAVGTGLVRIQPLTEVTSISRAGDGRYLVSTKQIDVTGKVLAIRTISCDRLFLGGGSMGTTQLLVKARATGTLPNLNEHVGTRWSSNGEIFMVRNVYTSTGSKTSVLPATGIDAYDHRGNQVYSMNIAMPLGIDTFSTAHITMTQTPELGRFTYDAQKQQSVLQWSTNAKTEPVTSARSVYDRINKVNGATYNKSWFGGKQVGDNATYHPLGGCPLGLATSDIGEVKGYPGLYVMDSSLFPDSLVANPALSTAAFAERNIERIIAGA
ncbi:GMC family oxidoreductase [Aquabacterium soli]|uniref:Cholesterol oxidase n=1 Tax=Aquabacterium soli TaxID=2493092 RepID=A0A426VGE7_9BURK|nr:GMC oxidoreductase [Aquabacterium soli]RRS05800.1 GMC family oxidoreductase [Aquabacterium soli]